MFQQSLVITKPENKKQLISHYFVLIVKLVPLTLPMYSILFTLFTLIHSTSVVGFGRVPYSNCLFLQEIKKKNSKKIRPNFTKNLHFTY